MGNKQKISRRSFVRNTAATAAGLTIIPGTVLGSRFGYTAPSDKLNIACIGIGGKGKYNLANMISENIVALCDIDWEFSKPVFEKYPGAKRFKDFRLMFDEIGKDIQAVVIATPDHTHTVAALAAMELGKHVYLQKPLTRTVYESRVLLNAARENGVVTQMGNEGHSKDTVREVSEWIWSGAIGEVKHVDTWINRPIWPQGINRPSEGMIVPDYIDWELYIGPAPVRPYHTAYHPFKWRGFWDFGTGALGDMGCHVLDVVVHALKLGHPSAVEASSSPVNTESAPVASIVRYEFPERDKIDRTDMPAVTVNWYDGGLLPSRPDELPDNIQLGKGGILFHGTRGKIICGQYGNDYKLLPIEKFTGRDKPAEKITRVSTSHEMDFVRACKESSGNRIMPCSNFEYSGPLNEIVVMGNLAIRLSGLGKKLNWDGEGMKITNLHDSETIQVLNGDYTYRSDKFIEFNAKEAAEQYIRPVYRSPWSLPKI